MTVFGKKEVLTPRERQINELKAEMRSCEQMMRQTEQLFHMAVDENLIEARIYQMKSLAKHYDYLLATLRRLIYTGEDCPTVVNV